MRTMTGRTRLLAAALFLAATAVQAQGAFTAPVTSVRAERTVVARGLEHPWSLAFLPDGRMLVTERPGRLRYVAPDGALSEPIRGLPPVEAIGQGGLLDVVLDPDFARNRRVYLSYAERDEGGVQTAVARGVLGSGATANQLSDVRVIFRQVPALRSSFHFGSRLVFDRQGALFVTTGDRGNKRDEAQGRQNLYGKILRIDTDGQPASGNPTRGSILWSLGHRNVQGAALHPVTGELWANEHGPQGGDEVNVVRAGQNYGWPVSTHGREYGSGAPIGKGPGQPGMVEPIHVWVPSIAPSGMAFYTATRHPQWTGSVFVGARKDRMLVRLVCDGERLLREERLMFDAPKRIRDVRQGPDGHLYVLTDEDAGEVWRVEPAK